MLGTVAGTKNTDVNLIDRVPERPHRYDLLSTDANIEQVITETTNYNCDNCEEKKDLDALSVYNRNRDNGKMVKDRGRTVRSRCSSKQTLRMWYITWDQKNEEKSARQKWNE